jgi:hypothetical protein
MKQTIVLVFTLAFSRIAFAADDLPARIDGIVAGVFTVGHGR